MLVLTIIVLFAVSGKCSASNTVEFGIGLPHFFNLLYTNSPNTRLSMGAGAGLIYIPPMRQACGADVKISGTNLEGVLRFNLFKGNNFFIGSRLGYMDFVCNSVQALNPPFYDSKIGVKGPYITPTVGWKWGSDQGFSFLTEFGVQFPISATKYETSTGPGTLDPSVRQTVDEGITHMAGTTPMLYLSAGYTF